MFSNRSQQMSMLRTVKKISPIFLIKFFQTQIISDIVFNPPFFLNIILLRNDRRNIQDKD